MLSASSSGNGVIGGNSRDLVSLGRLLEGNLFFVRALNMAGCRDNLQIQAVHEVQVSG